MFIPLPNESSSSRSGSSNESSESVHEPNNSASMSAKTSSCALPLLGPFLLFLSSSLAAFLSFFFFSFFAALRSFFSFVSFVAALCFFFSFVSFFAIFLSFFCLFPFFAAAFSSFFFFFHVLFQALRFPAFFQYPSPPPLSPLKLSALSLPPSSLRFPS